ncbi:MAG: acyl-CoA dehydrogenase family protein [Planctomycetota bacterium]|jgi:alkylation response protein AidB-like acyl-CoA dehydrogenase|nr:acyl-CoA dehydrogenase family protein [Planctomycetota bacterium]
MGFSDEEVMIRSTVAEFASKELEPRVRGTGGSPGWLGTIFGDLAELGLCGLLSPESVGGFDAGPVAFVLAVEELARVCPSTAAVFLGHVAWAAAPAAANDSSMAEALATGERLASVAVVPPGVEGNGEVCVSAVPVITDCPLVVVVGEEEVRLVDSQTPFSIENSGRVLGLRAAGLCDVRISGFGSGELWKTVSRDLPRLGHAALLCGLADSALRRALQQARERFQFGQSIGSFGGIRIYLSESSSSLASVRALLFDVAREMAAGGGPSVSRRVLQARLAAGKIAQKVTDRAVQIFGGYGYCEEYDVERHYRDAQAARVLFESPRALRNELATLLLED